MTNQTASDLLCNSLTPPLTAPTNIQQQQLHQLVTNGDNNNNNSRSISSQSMSLTSSLSSASMDSTSSEVKTQDKLFDQIEDMMCEYMREPSRHYLHCRVLRWCLDDDLSQQFSAVVVINPPTNKKGF